jgi:3-methyladenine DNA glycosylase AlkD
MTKEKEICLASLENDLKRKANPVKAGILQRFFKTGPGEYGEGDIFLGIVVPEQRKLVKIYIDLNMAEVVKLIKSRFHEARLIALLILVEKFKKAGQGERKKIFDFYLSYTKYINNWDLVDLSADKIVGAYLDGKDKKILFKLAGSNNMWERRISMLASFYFIKKGEPELALLLAEKLLKDKHDLIQKSAGWMLREIGKRCDEKLLESFLNKFYREMPRTMLRYSIERLPEAKRKMYLSKNN